ncbi:MAG TPA: hypothetical protein VL461_05425 [Dictyobacter sp.]|jgi:hypothetical protein|nr:hypothetical protein [Dictyobacter sp.]
MNDDPYQYQPQYLPGENSSSPDAPTLPHQPVFQDQQPQPPIRPEDLLQYDNQHYPVPGARSASSWRKDPAYRVLWIAIATIIVSGIIFAIIGGNALAHYFQPTQANNNNPNTQPTTVAQIIPTNTPTATPSPTPSPTPIVTPSPTPIPPTPTPQPTNNQQMNHGTNQQLTVNITQVPNQVQDGDTVAITVQTSMPDAQVTLTFTSDGSPAYFTMGPKNVGGDSMTTFHWTVNERSFNPFKQKGETVTTLISATAQSNDKQQQATSKMVSVKVQVTNNQG